VSGAAAGAPRPEVYPAELLGADGSARGLPSISGHWEVDGDAMEFVPTLPFVEGTTYAVAIAGDATLRITRPRTTGEPVTRVLEVFPTASEVPLNLLKLYVQFSAPMREGGAAEGVHVVRLDTGEALEDVLLPMEPELWDPTRRRLTALLDPGRVKRGVALHERTGYPLRLGSRVKVVVDAALHDAAGRPLVAGFERCYTVGPAIRERIDPHAWALEVPPRATCEPLVVRFAQPLDRALLERTLSVTLDGGMVGGRASVGDEERSWRFAPIVPWKASRYALRVQALLEDLAGNSVDRLFDRDLALAADQPLGVRAVERDFVPR